VNRAGPHPPSLRARVRGALGAALDRADELRRRLRPHAPEGLAPPSAEAGAGAELARRGRFDRDMALARYRHAVELEGRLYNYVLYPGDEALCVHFSAFFGEWGEQRRNRAQYQGYFHRMRMFWPLRRYRFLFLCDTFGADDNGTYYKGEDGDFFVERAMERILDRVQEQVGVDSKQVVMLGSSMGATAALRFALTRQTAGAVAVSPHIDLDLSARFQGRERHVAAMLGADDVESSRHYPVTREVRALAETAPLGPRIAIQSMKDDRGVHAEQVIPFVERWQGRGGTVDCDFRPEGGHTSEYATADWFEHRILWCLDEHLDQSE
jgi:pimeloyl-ACP methyl ester carboxylesterase